MKLEREFKASGFGFAVLLGGVGECRGGTFGDMYKPVQQGIVAAGAYIRFACVDLRF